MSKSGKINASYSDEGYSFAILGNNHHKYKSERLFTIENNKVKMKKPILIMVVVAILGACAQGAPKHVASCTGIKAANLISACDVTTGICLFGGEPGHYSVVIEFDNAASTLPKIYSESRRLMFDSAVNMSTKHCTQFTVNVREREGQPLQESAADGIAGLNLHIPKNLSAVKAIYVEKVESPRVLFIAGDSTVCDQDPQWDRPASERFSGWGQLLPAYFNADISVANYADSGEGTAAFRVGGGALWEPLSKQLKSGDWVLIQLGHNDKKTPAVVYRSRVLAMLQAIKAKGASPVLVSPMVRNNSDALYKQHIYGDLVVKDVLTHLAKLEQIPFIDLMSLTHGWAETLGQEDAQKYFVKTDKTHSNEQGAEIFAQMIVKEIVRQQIGLDEYLR